MRNAVRVLPVPHAINELAAVIILEPGDHIVYRSYLMGPEFLARLRGKAAPDSSL